MNSTDEQALGERLRADLAALPAAPAPVSEVLRRGAARRARRRAAAGAAVATAAAVTAVLVSQAGGVPARTAPVSRVRPAGHPAPARPRPASSVPARAAGVVAAGTAGGRAWQLSVGNIADPGARCLPALLLNGTDADLLPGAAPTPGAIGGLAFLSAVPGQPGTGYAVLRVAPTVSALTARLADGSRLAARPVTVRACGRSLRLAGFAYPVSGVTRITAYAGTQPVSAVSPAGGLAPGTSPAGSSPPPGTGGAAGRTLRLVPGVWQHLWQSAARPGSAALPSGTIGAGRAGGISWRISVLLGADGECYTATTYGEPGASGSPLGGQVATGGSNCTPITPPPGTVVLHQLPRPASTGLAGYAALLPARAVSVVATLAGGGTIRSAARTVAGREYAAVAVPAGRTLARVTAYDAAGHPVGTAPA